MLRGAAFHGEVDSVDASGGEAFKIFKSGETAEYSLESTEFITITDFSVIRAVAGTFSIVADADADGRRVIKNPGDAAVGVIREHSQPYVCPVGVTPKLFAALGDVVATIEGFITGA